MSFFSEPIHHLYSKLIKNNFKSLFEINADYPAGYLDWDFNSYPSSYEKYRKFLAYSEPYTKDYIFRILYKEIDLTSQFDNEFIDFLTKSNNNNNKHNNVEYIFDKYHPMWKYFYVVRKNYDKQMIIDELDTTKLYNIQNIDDDKKDDNNEKYYDNFVYKIKEKDDMYRYRITQPDLDTIKEFISENKPLYMHILPENITHFKHVYIHLIYDEISDRRLKLLAMSDKYLYYIYSQT